MRDPLGAVPGAALLEEPLALHAVGQPHHRQRAALQVGEQHRRDPGVVVDHLTFGEAGRGVQHLVRLDSRSRRPSTSTLVAVLRPAGWGPGAWTRLATTCEGSRPSAGCRPARHKEARRAERNLDGFDQLRPRDGTGSPGVGHEVARRALQPARGRHRRPDPLPPGVGRHGRGGPHREDREGLRDRARPVRDRRAGRDRRAATEEEPGRSTSRTSSTSPTSTRCTSSSPTTSSPTRTRPSPTACSST